MKKLVPAALITSLVFATGSNTHVIAETQDKKQQPSAEDILGQAASLHEELDSVYFKAERTTETAEGTVDSSTVEKQWLYEQDENFYRHIEYEEEDRTSYLFTDLEDPNFLIEYAEGDDEAQRYENAFTENADLGHGAHSYEYLLEHAELSLIGEEEVNGYQTYHVQATQEGQTTDYWFDQDTFYEVKTQYQSFGTETYSTEILDYELNPEFDKGLFQAPDEIETLGKEVLSL
ncbi:hypothetical protein E2R51_15615 [Jeotgalibacillus sp. S-D1]|uniref:LolA family protein n=1 Tax=Jeotgalibacillus sp. S-D1 TaxID=2552189 RepID=UPI001059B330|nr:hypothetical protein [Jeotgalibacillus sp. S-D1]TDL31210.1 hypothetical protein E2R51_15615 [Jeotgalibacillus sp. S-D1]